MPPIPIYSDAPINPQTAAAKPDGTTPQTAASNDQPVPTRTIPATTTATTTAAASTDPPPPQPGARPVPPTAQPQQPATTTGSYSPPAPPQPGPAPAAAPTGTVTATVTQTVTALGSGGGTTPAAAAAAPPQFSTPPPTANAAPTRSTMTTAQPAYQAQTGPTTLNLGPAPVGGGGARQRAPSLEHPPGYQQNPYAADGTAAQRARLEDAAAAARAEESVEAGIWGSVKAVAGKVGENLRKGEEEAWRLVNGAGK